jgi:hypothetical protein
LVAVGATLITQPAGSKTPKRTDYTNNYRDALTQSLESLRANWVANRQRIANAIPTHSTTLDTSTPNAASSNPLVQEWSQTLAEENAAKKRSPSSTARSEAPAPPIKAPTVSTVEPMHTTPAPVVDVNRPDRSPPTEATGRSAMTVTEPRPAPEPVQPPTLPPQEIHSPAPVVDGSSEVAPENNMMALSQKSEGGAWAFYAEQVAQARGCTLTDAGVQLIESRGDGELYKIPCEGAGSFLLQCQKGTCQELAATNRRPTPPRPSAPVAKAEVRQPAPNPVRTEPKATKTSVQPVKPEAKAAAKPPKPEPKTAKIEAKTAKPEPKTTKADTKATKPEPKATKVDTKATKTEPKTAKTDTKASKPEPKTAKADTKATKPELKTAKADTKASKAEPKTAKVDTKAPKPEPKITKGDAKTTKPDPKIGKPEAKSSKPK